MPEDPKVLRRQELARILEQDARDLYFLTRHEPSNVERILRKLKHVEGLTSALRGEIENCPPSWWDPSFSTPNEAGLWVEFQPDKIPFGELGKPGIVVLKHLGHRLRTISIHDPEVAQIVLHFIETGEVR